MNRRRVASLVVSFALAVPARAQDADPFPPAAPESVGMSAHALAKLADVVRGFVAADDVVGAELLVIKSDKTVLDECFGWKDREDKVAMAPGTIFCVRSMTKPVAGTAVEMLIEEKKLALEDRASKYLSSFDNEKSREITIRQLFHHTSGLPLSSLLSHRLDTLTSIREVADLAGAHGPDFAPGDHLSYSDDGADTLGALVAVASGKKLEDFLAERLFGPLGMRDTIAFVAADHPLRPRIASNYMGGPKNWTRYWSPKDPPIFPFLLASQALYCTPKDYARFLSLWKSRGSWNGKRLLESRTTRRALELGTPMNFPCGFEGVELDYGELWMLYADKQKKDELYAFGHGGSDGTFAYVFPKLDLMVLYFTQSRNTQTGFPFEQALQREIVDPMLHVDRKPAAAYGESELDALAGWYWDPDRADVIAIARKGSGLEIEIPATAALELKATSTRDHWILAISPDQAFDAVRADDGSVTAWIGRNAKEEQSYPRWKADPSLPSVDDVMALRKRAVDWEKIASVGAVRVHGKLEMPALKTTGTFTSTSRGLDRYRIDLVTTMATAHVVVDGAVAWTSNTMLSGGKPTRADEATYARLRYSTPLHVVADWRPMFRELRVIAKTKVGEAEALELRATPERGRARTLLVDAKTGLLLGEKLIQPEGGLGEFGSSIRYDDWREVGAIRLPFHTTVEHPTPLLGTYETHWDAVETNVELAPDFFAMPKSD